MKILVTLYYIDFARYFVYLANEVKKLEPSAEFLFVSFYPSAHHYLEQQGERSIFLPDAIRAVEPDMSVDYSSFIDYPSRLLPNCDVEKLKQEAARCGAVFRSLFETTSFDRMISSGDTRMQVETSLYFARSASVPILFFEQGVFGTTILDSKGVNANTSFRGCHECMDVEVNLSQIEAAQQRPGDFSDHISLVNRWKEKLDLFYLYPLPGSRVPLYARSGDSFVSFVWNRLRSKFRPKNNVPLPDKFVLLPLQMPVDAQMLYYSPLYDDMADLILDVIDALPEGYRLVVREHPNYRDRYSQSVYDAIHQSAQASLINDTDLQATIASSEAVVVVNSAVGLESVSQYKKVLLVGDAYYEHESAMKKLSSRSDMRSQLRELLTLTVDRQSIDLHLSHLLDRHLLPGHFRDAELSGGNRVAQKILAHGQEQ